MRLLIVEDHETTAHALESGLRREGFTVRLARTGDEAFRLITTASFDLIVLDWMLPGRDGIEILKALRARGASWPVLLMSARDAVEDRVFGFESGADDYLTKPFAFEELVARVRSLLRRGPLVEPGRRRVADLTIDMETRRVWRGGREIRLTPREFDLLVRLLRDPGQVVTRETLVKEVWGAAQRATALDGAIDVHVANLRRKVDGRHATKLIHTVRGSGLMVREESGG